MGAWVGLHLALERSHRVKVRQCATLSKRIHRILGGGLGGRGEGGGKEVMIYLLVIFLCKCAIMQSSVSAVEFLILAIRIGLPAVYLMNSDRQVACYRSADRIRGKQL
jgi:hypothetical protein